MGDFPRIRFLLPLTLVACLVAGGCDKQEKAPAEPVPFEKKPLPALTQPMKVPSSGGDATAELLSQVIRGSPSQAEPAVNTTLQLFGIPVVDHDGAVSQVPGISVRGVPTPAWAVQSLAFTAAAAPVMRVSDLFGPLSNLSELGGVDLTRLVVEDWAAAFKSSYDDTRQAATLLLEIGFPDGPANDGDLQTTAPGRLAVTSLQAQMILRRLAVEIRIGSGPTAANKNPSYRDVPIKMDGTPPCSMTHDQDKIVGYGSTGTRVLFGQLLKYLQDKGVIDANSNAPKNIKAANLLIDAANYGLMIAALRVDASLDRPPLVRTKETTKAGETKKLQALVHFKAGSEAMVNCFRLALSSVGIKGLTSPPDGPLASVRVGFRGREGTSDLEFDPAVWFRAPVDVITDKDGKASVNVEGRPQQRAVAQDAKPLDRTARLSIEVVPVEVSFFKDMMSIASQLGLSKDSTGRVPGVGPGVVLETLKRAIPISFPRQIDVRDWQGGRRFTLRGSYHWSRSGPLSYANWLDSDGSTTFNGVMGCVPPDAASAVWICFGQIEVRGSGINYQFAKTLVQITDKDCIGPWTVNATLRFNAYSLSELLDEVDVSPDPSNPIQSACGFVAGPGLPIDPDLIGRALQIPEQGSGLQGTFPAFDPENGHTGERTGEVALTILEEK
jgi:hypothetical protein